MSRPPLCMRNPPQPTGRASALAHSDAVAGFVLDDSYGSTLDVAAAPQQASVLGAQEPERQQRWLAHGSSPPAPCDGDVIVTATEVPSRVTRQWGLWGEITYAHAVPSRRQSNTAVAIGAAAVGQCDAVADFAGNSTPGTSWGNPLASAELEPHGSELETMRE